MKTAKHNRWPILQACVDKQQLAYVDYFLAERILSSDPSCDQDVAAFICHLAISTRLGNMCIQIDGKNIFPSVSECWKEKAEVEELQNLSSADTEQLTDMILKGSRKIPSSLIAENDEENSEKVFYKNSNLTYFQKYWLQEKRILQYLEILQKNHPSINWDEDLIKKELEKENLTAEQGLAIVKALQNSITFISGGPGTGKTYTAGKLIKIVWNLLNEQQKKRCEIMLAAPTGKAASNLKESIARSLDDIQNISNITTSTLHSLLRVSKTIRKSNPSTLSADLLIVDESSMIDSKLMEKLLSSLKVGCRIIFLGDPYQLPPVGTGMIFSNLVKRFPDISIGLLSSKRTELKSILNFASAVKNGVFISALQLLKGTDPSLVWRTFSPSEAKEKILKKTDCCILSTLRKGPLGVDVINELVFQNRIKKNSSDSIPILILTNDSNMGLSNGDMGILFCKNPKELSETDYAIFKNQSNLRQIPALLLPKFEYAYCLSVHKSQGSEFDHVLLLLPEGSEVFGREILYTAATRARKSLEIWSSEETLKACIEKSTLRLSGLTSTQTEDKLV